MVQFFCRHSFCRLVNLCSALLLSDSVPLKITLALQILTPSFNYLANSWFLSKFFFFFCVYEIQPSAALDSKMESNEGHLQLIFMIKIKS